AGILSRVHQWNNDATRTGIECLANHCGVVSLHTYKTSRAIGRVDRHQVAQYSGVSQQAMLAIDRDVVIASHAQSFGGDGAIKHTPVSKDGLSAFGFGDKFCCWMAHK